MSGVQTRKQIRVQQETAVTEEDENDEHFENAADNNGHDPANASGKNAANPAIEKGNAEQIIGEVRNMLGAFRDDQRTQMEELKKEILREVSLRTTPINPTQQNQQSSSNHFTSGGAGQTQTLAERVFRGSPQQGKENLANPPLNRRNRRLPPHPHVQSEEDDEPNGEMENRNVAFMLNQTLIQQNMFYTQMARANEATQFAQISATLANLAGNEGRGRTSNFFAHLEAVTTDWTPEKRALLLSTHLVGTARTLYDGLPEQEKRDYGSIKNAVMNSSLGGALAQRSAAQAKLMRGLKPKNGQGLREFGIFVLTSVRESLLPDTPDKVVEDLAKSYFLNGIPNFHVKNSLTLIHDAANYYELINKAEELDSRMQSLGRARILNIKAIVEPNGIASNTDIGERESWIKTQLKGQYGRLIKYITQKEQPHDLAELQKILEQLNTFTVHESLLHYIDPQSQELRLVIPSEFQREIFHEKHAGTLGTHQGGRKIYELLKKQYFWPNMRADCERWCRACPVCACCREPRKNTPPLKPFVSNEPMQLISVDILQLGLTTAGNKNVLVVIDHFSKFLVAEPLATKTAEEVAQTLVNCVFLKYGMAKHIHSDKGREFINATINRICKIMGTKQTTTSGYNPRENGAAERINRDLISMLRKSCIIPQEWDQRLQFAVFSHNISVHASTNESPFYLMHARDPNVPSAVDKKLLPSKYCADIAGYKEMVTENMEKIVKKVNEDLERAKDKYKLYFDANKKVTPNKYRAGQRVMLCDQKIDTAPNKKLNFKFKGPYRIIKINGSYAKIRSINTPSEKEKTIPTEWLTAVPEECAEFTAEKEEDRAKLIETSQKLAPPQTESAANRKDEHAHIFAILALSNNLGFQMATKLKEKIGQWTSDPKPIYYFSLYDGLGPHARCTAGSGDHVECRTIIATDVLPYAELVDEGVRCLTVPSLAGQLFLRSFEDAAPDKLTKAANCIKLDSITLSKIEKTTLLSECQRRLHCCTHARRLIKECMEKHIPIRCIGTFANIVNTKLRGDMIDHGDHFNDELGVGWEKAYTNAASLIDREQIDGTFHLFVPDTVDTAQLGSIGAEIVTRRFPSLTALTHSFRRLLFLSAAQATVLFLPAVDSDTIERLPTLLKVMAGNSQIAFFVVPPPPAKSEAYDSTIALLSGDHGPNVHTNLSSKGRTLFSHGWFGDHPNTFHLKDGKWTRNGLMGIQRFLAECIGLTWAFPAKELFTKQPVTAVHATYSNNHHPHRGSIRKKETNSPAKRTISDGTELLAEKGGGLHSRSPSENRRSRPETAVVVRVDSTRPPVSHRRPLLDRVSLNCEAHRADGKRRRSER